MKPKALRTYGRYIRRVADLIGLRDWAFELMHVPPEDPKAWAVVEPIEGRKFARVWLCIDFDQLTPEVQRHTVVHELLHCHLAAAVDVVRLDALNQMSQSAYDVLMGSFHRQVEYAVDGIAEGVAQGFPTP